MSQAQPRSQFLVGPGLSQLDLEQFEADLDRTVHVLTEVIDDPLTQAETRQLAKDALERVDRILQRIARMLGRPRPTT